MPLKREEINCKMDSLQIQEVQQPNTNFNESEETRLQKRIETLCQRGYPINILVIGPTGTGKSTLINALMGDAVAEVGHGAASVQNEVKLHEGKYSGIKIRIYDTTGFSDSEGKSDITIVREIAKENKFDLILICLRMDCRADDKVRTMFTIMGEMIRNEMWERVVVVLTFANAFLQLRDIKRLDDADKSEAINNEIEQFKKYVHEFLRSSVKEDIIEKIPFCIAGEEEERQLPTTDDWLDQLWRHCIAHSSDEVRSFLSLLAQYRLLFEAGAISGSSAMGCIVGGLIGGGVGSVIPVAGTITGAAVGAGIGLGIAAAISAAIVAIKRHVKRNRPATNTEQTQQ